jgi:hypothetical protein
VNGSLNAQDNSTLTDTFQLTLQPPPNQIVQFILTYPLSTTAALVNFVLVIRRKDDPTITDNTNVLQACVSQKAGQQACSIVLQQTDFAVASPLPIEISVVDNIINATTPHTQGTGNYTLEIVSTVSPEVAQRKTICPDTGPSTIQEQEPNGKDVLNATRTAFVFDVSDPLVFQGVGTLSLVNGCIPIRGGQIADAIIETPVVNGVATNPAAQADGVDFFELNVDNTVPTVALILNATNFRNNALNLVIDEPIPPTTPGGTTLFRRLAECATTGPFNPARPSTPAVTCAVSVPSSRNLRVGVWSSFDCTTKGCSVIDNYSLDMIAIAQPTIVVPPAPPSAGGKPTNLINP